MATIWSRHPTEIRIPIESATAFKSILQELHSTAINFKFNNESYFLRRDQNYQGGTTMIWTYINQFLEVLLLLVILLKSLPVKIAQFWSILSNFIQLIKIWRSLHFLNSEKPIRVCKEWYPWEAWRLFAYKPRNNSEGVAAQGHDG